LAISLLLEALREQGQVQLQEAFRSLDRNQQTPLQIAQCYQTIQEEERQSVARWDTIAGGPADWDKCVQLLGTELDGIQQKEDEGQHHTSTTARTTRNESSTSTGPVLQQLPSHKFSSADCLDCGEECVTASWTNAFTKALQNNVNTMMQQQQQKFLIIYCKSFRMMAQII
jgi:hypothetical protein